MKTAFLFGAIFFLTVLAPQPQPAAGGLEVGSPLEVESAVPEMGADTDSAAVRPDGTATIDGYLWSDSRAAPANGGLLVDGSSMLVGGRLGADWSAAAWESE